MSLEFREGAELGLECTPGKWQHVRMLAGSPSERARCGAGEQEGQDLEHLGSVCRGAGGVLEGRGGLRRSPRRVGGQPDEGKEGFSGAAGVLWLWSPSGSGGLQRELWRGRHPW